MDIFLMIAFVIIIIIVFLIDYKKSEPTNNSFIPDNDVKRNKPDSEYLSIKQKHQNKTLTEIRDYIELKRKENKDYWEKHRREYIILKIKEYHLKMKHSKK
jgi:hypothetical protein